MAVGMATSAATGDCRHVAAQREELKAEIGTLHAEAEQIAGEARELAGEVPFWGGSTRALACSVVRPRATAADRARGQAAWSGGHGSSLMDVPLFPTGLWGGFWRFAGDARRLRMASGARVPMKRRSLSGR